jgi:hypothetical protein
MNEACDARNNHRDSKAQGAMLVLQVGFVERLGMMQEQFSQHTAPSFHKILHGSVPPLCDESLRLCLSQTKKKGMTIHVPAVSRSRFSTVIPSDTLLRKATRRAVTSQFEKRFHTGDIEDFLSRLR